MWAKVKAACCHSVTIAWGYALVGSSYVLDNLDTIAATLGDPDLKTQFETAVHSEVHAMAWFARVVGVITIAARARSLIKKAAS